MTDHAHELRRHAYKIGRPAGDVPAVMHQAAAHIEDLERRLREAERWRDAVIDQLDVMHITCARHKDDPVFAVHDCMAYSVNLALDPAVSEQAQALLDAGREADRAELDKKEPVAWMNEQNGFICKDPKNADFCVPLYAAPPVTAPARLTDSEAEAVARIHGTGGWQTLGDMMRFSRAIETAVLRANGFDIQPAKGT